MLKTVDKQRRIWHEYGEYESICKIATSCWNSTLFGCVFPQICIYTV